MALIPSLLIVLAVVLIFVVWSVEQLRRAVDTNNELLAIDRHRPDTTEELARVSRATAENYQRILELTLAVDEGVRSVARAEKRVAKTVQGARRLVKESGLEHPGLDAEVAELRERDGDAGDEGELPAVQEDVDHPEHWQEGEVTGIPGYDGTA